jgi:hypothetical protein
MMPGTVVMLPQQVAELLQGWVVVQIHPISPFTGTDRIIIPHHPPAVKPLLGRDVALGPAQRRLLLTCRDEQQQLQLLARFQAEGLPCRALLS